MAEKGVDDSNNITENNAHVPSHEGDIVEFAKCVKGPIFVIWGPIGERFCEIVLGFARKNKAIEKVNLIIESYGGNVNTAFKSANILQNCCNKITVYIPQRAKGAATLICLSADEIILPLGAELGPLDVQIINPKNPAETTSALENLNALTALLNLLHSEVEVSAITLSRFSGAKADESLSLAMQFVEIVARPLIEQANIPDIGTVRNALDISERYGRELLIRRGVEKAVSEVIVNKLVNLYPSHSFVIDFHEACKIGLPVREPNKEEDQGLNDLYNYLRTRIDKEKQNECYGLLTEVSN